MARTAMPLPIKLMTNKYECISVVEKNVSREAEYLKRTVEGSLRQLGRTGVVQRIVLPMNNLAALRLFSFG